jgi:hypothetical protein
MTKGLSIHHFFTEAEPLSVQILEDIQNIEKDIDLVVMPEVNLAVLEEYGATPDHLRDRGDDVPDDEDEALEYAVGEFQNSDSFYDWEREVRPGDGMLYLWPLEIPPGYDDPSDPDHTPFDHQGLANKLLENGLNCCYISGEHQGRAYQGFILTGGGMDHSDDLAMAYVLAGCVPPNSLLENAVSNTSNDDWKEIFLDCMERGRDFFLARAERFQRTLDMYRPSAPSLT